MGWIPYPRSVGAGSLNVPVYGLQSGGGAPGGLQFGMAPQPVQTVGSAQMPMGSSPSPAMLASLLRNPSATSPAPAGAPDPAAPQATAPAPAGPSASPQGGDPFAAARQAVAQHVGAPIGRKSDRRLKSDVTRIGTLPNGLPVYRYRLEGGAPEIGLMAQEVMALHPGAVWEAEDGFLRVRYDLAVL